MDGFDFTPLFRSTIGFDRLTRLVDAATRTESGAYPPYNIEQVGENAYRVTIAVAGFSADELDVTVKESALLVSGRSKSEDDGSKFLHRGLARRAFERHFQLADHIRVTGANLENGLLHVDLVREIPEAMKPRKVAIASGDKKQVIEQQAA